MIRHIPDKLRRFERHIDFMQHVIQQAEIKSMAEIGVLWGDLACYLAPLVELYVMVDPWERYPDEWREADSLSKFDQDWWDHVYAVAMEKMDPIMSRCLVYRTTSVAAAGYVADESLDCVFIDALHHYEPMLTDLAAWLPKIKPDGLLAGHDWWDDGTDYGATMEGVKRALLDTFPQEIIHVSRKCSAWDHAWLVYKEDIG